MSVIYILGVLAVASAAFYLGRWVGYIAGYRKGAMPVAISFYGGGSGGVGNARGALGGAGSQPDYEDGSPMP